MERTVAVLVVIALTASGAVAGRQKTPRVGSAGVTLALPQGWHAWVPQGPPGSVVGPLTRVVAVSAPFRFEARGCQVAGYKFSSRAVALVVLEWVGPPRSTRGWRPRPRRFTSRTLRVSPPPAIECFDGPGGSAQFVDHGRRFGAYILLGRRAPPALADRARAVLDTLDVEPRPR
jgi:hypothetical protein